MDIVIIDDLVPDQQLLSSYISTYCEAKKLAYKIHRFENGESFLSNFKKQHYDLIFLDIYLDGIDGMSIAESIRKIDKNCLFVFSTSSQSHAVESFRVRAFDYLLKPYTFEQFKQTMDLCCLSLSKYSYYIEVKVGRIYSKILINDIVYTDYYNHYIQIHTTANTIRSYMSFDEFSPLLTIYPQFLSCYRNCLINMDKVKTADTNNFVMITNESIPIKKRIKTQILQNYSDYLFSCVEQGINQP